MGEKWGLFVFLDLLELIKYYIIINSIIGLTRRVGLCLKNYYYYYLLEGCWGKRILVGRLATLAARSRDSDHGSDAIFFFFFPALSFPHAFPSTPAPAQLREPARAGGGSRKGILLTGKCLKTVRVRTLFGVSGCCVIRMGSLDAPSFVPCVLEIRVSLFAFLFLFSRSASEWTLLGGLPSCFFVPRLSRKKHWHFCFHASTTIARRWLTI